ncbi:HAD-IA family hydrolase [Cellulomonas sp. Sa3CUA2]|uniref:HAD-IA family hydrolase n=1 Tax=Cellulomonas avistercoris TaxID=2762242 RepID=A0ABR8QEB2_9CELL|nr:HAD-IA family hydrolase [Cellulomonas avistercoris]MBD7918772.1 HAD-IA family hydrolase [Cellulomonas avistercoris]
MRFEVDAILFDIDGTLVDSTGAVVRAWEAWSAAWGIDLVAVLRVCHGRRSEDTVAEFLPSGQRAAAVAELERLELADLGDVTALPATRDLLAALPESRWAAVTSGSRALMRARLAAAGLPVPDVLVAAEDVLLGKPDPQGYLQAARALGFDIRRCLVVEDAPAGLEAGRAAGAHVLAVATSHPAHDLCAADAVISDLRACSVESTVSGLMISTAVGPRADPLI